MDQIQTYLAQHQDRFLNELFEWLRIPSVSADSRHKDDMKRAADWLVDRFKALDVDTVAIHPTPGHPIVFAEKKGKAGAPTVLVYGHYDVQPPDPLNLWHSPPFEPVVKDGNIYARGSCDDKGQVYMHVKALEILNQGGELPCNIKFLVEGEEEIGSNNLEKFIAANKDLLACDIVLVSDTSMIANDVPSITIGLRGMSYLEVEVTGPNRDLHSGVYGGAVDNPINILCEMIASLKDEEGKVTIPGFYDQVKEYSVAERKEFARRPFDNEAYMQDLQVGALRGESGYSPIERSTIRPTLDVNGIWGGYTGEGAKTVLPSKAFAKISMRLVPDQTPDETTRMFTEHFQKLAPPTVKVKVTPHHGGKPAVTSIHTAGYKAAANAMMEAFGKDAIPTMEGGSIPIVALFQELLGRDTVLLGFGLNSDDIHSPNEHYGVFNYLKGIETIPRFHHWFAKLHS